MTQRPEKSDIRSTGERIYKTGVPHSSVLPTSALSEVRAPATAASSGKDLEVLGQTHLPVAFGLLLDSLLFGARLLIYHFRGLLDGGSFDLLHLLAARPSRSKTDQE
jgi:hypothetical protein